MLRAFVVCAPLGLLPVLAGSPASAHGGDPRVHPTLTSVSGDLPGRVSVQVVSSMSEELVVANPTSTPLRVLSPRGRPFLEISEAGVRADLHAAYFYETLGPPDDPAAVPGSAHASAAPRWRRVAAGSSFGWFDRRLHPASADTRAEGSHTGGSGTGPGGGDAADDGPVTLARWTVPMTYGAGAQAQPVTVTGRLVREPVRGSWVPGRIAAPAGVRVQVIPGQRPALAVTRTAASSVTVLGPAGQPMLRLDRRGVSWDPLSAAALTSSRSAHVLPPQGAEAEGLSAFERGRFHAWLEPRVAPAAAPAHPDRASTSTWWVPVVVDGRRTTLRGVWAWQPAAPHHTAAATSREGASPPARSWEPAVGLAGVVLAGGTALAGLRRVRAGRLALGRRG